MLTHKAIWRGIDHLAERKGLSASGLAKKAGLDPTTFNKSKRTTKQGKSRWPSTESVSKILEATSTSMAEFVGMKAQLTLNPQSVSANGPLAVERGTYSVTFTPPGATAPITDTGKYLAHWHLIGGKWMMVDDIWNSDLPVAPAPAPRS